MGYRDGVDGEGDGQVDPLGEGTEEDAAEGAGGKESEYIYIYINIIYIYNGWIHPASRRGGGGEEL